MTACRCEACCPHDPAPTYTQAWRLECEARFVLAMSFATRRPFLDHVAERRGAAGRARLEGEVMRLHRQERAENE